jgi:hypothetical protein
MIANNGSSNAHLVSSLANLASESSGSRRTEDPEHESASRSVEANLTRSLLNLLPSFLSLSRINAYEQGI